MTGKCSICRRRLDNPEDPLSGDCGGDCIACMADCGDPECVVHVIEVTGKMPDGSEPTWEDRNPVWPNYDPSPKGKD